MEGEVVAVAEEAGEAEAEEEVSEEVAEEVAVDSTELRNSDEYDSGHFLPQKMAALPNMVA